MSRYQVVPTGTQLVPGTSGTTNWYLVPAPYRRVPVRGYQFAGRAKWDEGIPYARVPVRTGGTDGTEPVPNYTGVACRGDQP